ncbi:MAG TPA: PKD domain-containing protein, partial [Flavobacteriales bacterium]|nr:PKD domain-containing protein [Flavobacteriales bacterium]
YASDSLYTWSMGNGDTVTGGMPTYTFNSSGTYTITVVLTNTSNCTTTSSGQNEVVVNPLPTATCTADPAQTDIRTPVIYFSGGVDDLSYAWGFGDGDSSYAQNPAHTYPGVGSYDVTLNVVDSNNCQNSCDLTIIIDPYYDIVIPNAFTPNPNGPGTGAYDIEALDNDVFFGLTDYVEEYHMMIFNRWGELIFETFDILIGWDGYYRGKLSQQDVYAWKINVRYIDGKEIERLGDVTLIR